MNVSMLTGRLSVRAAKEIVDEINKKTPEQFSELSKKWFSYELTEDIDNNYSSLRDCIINVYRSFAGQGNLTLKKRQKYLIDLNVGLELYKCLDPENGFTNVLASDDDFWRYLSIKIFPDITYLRYPGDGKFDPTTGKHEYLKHKRFYSGTRRIWLKTLWWYIHLSWQGSKEKTYEVLDDNLTDNINKLIETPGKGYRLSLYRQMMRTYHETRPHNEKTKDFASFTQLNNAKCFNIEPKFVKGGEAAYTQSLIDEVHCIVRGDQE